jgi:predicted AAA+ superfamily ATPase
MKFSKDYGKMYENAVFLKLKQESFDNRLMSLFYWKNILHEEVDFVIKEGLKIKQLIQVCYNIEDLETKKREIKSLIKASEELKCNNLLVITNDKEGEEKVEGKKIIFIPLWKWLLN